MRARFAAPLRFAARWRPAVGAVALATAHGRVWGATWCEEPYPAPPKKPCKSSAHAPPDPSTIPASEEEVEELLSSSRILLFMKGSPDSPRCRFSRAAVQILREHRVDFDHVDVLEKPSLRLALQARWPTFPQLYAEGVLLGGSDQLRELAQQGDLLDALRSSTARERAALALTLQRPS
ncbi:Monothiol glutaredoxin-S17 [Symbiodinium microadriaticum]|uniref:Monothiol glutaredoxin-S17 n=1 Tax=Symbiodinium microadriaticum TaxID=2951 RepID=A0A1Q9ED78_SYMMI|nr:Monothiol glutaredoxin-S17 [Symbiodinium microadriaticum]